MLVVTDIPFPYGVALSSRLKAFCSLISGMGYSVHVIALLSRDKKYIPGNVYELNDCTFEITSARELRSIDSFVGNKTFLPRIEKYVQDNKIQFLFSSSCECYLKRLLKLAKRNNIPYFIEQCEIYDLSSYKFRRLDIRYYRYRYHFFKLYKRVEGVVVISRLLEKHFQKLNVPTVRIPTILDVQNMIYSSATYNRRIRLIYSGAAWGKKELLAPIIKVLGIDAILSNEFEFHIYGTTREQVLSDSPEVETILDNSENTIFVHGIIPQKQMHDIICKSDYQIFIRPDRMSSHAGFPTKLGESMAAGTPVITNDTGDIALYLNDNINGYLLEDRSEDAVRKVLQKVLKLSDDQKEAMRLCARKTAEEYFDYRCYMDEFSRLLKTEV